MRARIHQTSVGDPSVVWTAPLHAKISRYLNASGTYDNSITNNKDVSTAVNECTM